LNGPCCLRLGPLSWPVEQRASKLQNMLAAGTAAALASVNTVCLIPLGVCLQPICGQQQCVDCFRAAPSRQADNSSSGVQGLFSTGVLVVGGFMQCRDVSHRFSLVQGWLLVAGAYNHKAAMRSSWQGIWCAST
jgi:hypothetical protein